MGRLAVRVHNGSIDFDIFTSIGEGFFYFFDTDIIDAGGKIILTGTNGRQQRTTTRNVPEAAEERQICVKWLSSKTDT